MLPTVANPFCTPGASFLSAASSIRSDSSAARDLRDEAVTSRGACCDTPGTCYRPWPTPSARPGRPFCRPPHRSDRIPRRPGTFGTRPSLRAVLAVTPLAHATDRGQPLLHARGVLFVGRLIDQIGFLGGPGPSGRGRHFARCLL